MSLTDGRGGLRLAEVALAAGHDPVHDQAPHHAGLDLLKVVRFRADLGPQEADVRLVAALLLREEEEEEEREIKKMMKQDCNGPKGSG